MGFLLTAALALWGACVLDFSWPYVLLSVALSVPALVLFRRLASKGWP